MPHASLLITGPAAALLLLLAIPLGIAGLRARAGRLDRMGRLGVHTVAAQSSDRAFELGNRVAAPLMLGAAAVGTICAVLVLALPLGTLNAVVIAAVGLVGVLGQSTAASAVAERAARTVPPPARRPEGGGCGGACGCGAGGCGAGCEGDAGVAAVDPRLGSLGKIRDFAIGSVSS